MPACLPAIPPTCPRTPFPALVVKVAALEEGAAAARGVVLAVAAARLDVAYEDVDRREGLVDAAVAACALRALTLDADACRVPSRGV